MSKPLQRLAKWRALFAGWQLGTRAADDPECQAVRDHRESTIMLRAEVNTLFGLLLAKGIITPEEFREALDQEAELLSKDYERRFPGVKATDHGLQIDPHRAIGWMRNWKP